MTTTHTTETNRQHRQVIADLQYAFGAAWYMALTEDPTSTLDAIAAFTDEDGNYDDEAAEAFLTRVLHTDDLTN